MTCECFTAFLLNSKLIFFHRKLKLEAIVSNELYWAQYKYKFTISLIMYVISIQCIDQW